MENLLIIMFLALVSASYVYHLSGILVRKIIHIKDNIIIGKYQPVRVMLLASMTLVIIILVIGYELLF